MQFHYYLPANLTFGNGSTRQVGNITAQWGKRALLVTGKNSTRKSGLLDRVIHILKEAGVPCVVFDQVTSNPLSSTVAEGVSLLRKENCDVVVGLGGGSILDASKAIAFSAKNPGEIFDYIFGKKVGTDALPLILVPTTCGTGSEGNGLAVLTNPENGDKKSLHSELIVAKASVIDPELMYTLPKKMLASVGFDALAHNMEAYVSRKAQPLTNLMARSAMELIIHSLPNLYAGREDPAAWERLTFASTIGGMVIDTAGVGAPHGMEHPASGLRNIVHGMGLAALTPEIIRRSSGSSPEKYGDISKLLGGKGASDCADQVEKFLGMIDMHVTLGELGIKREDVAWMTENCLKVSTGAMGNHPADFSGEIISNIYLTCI